MNKKKFREEISKSIKESKDFKLDKVDEIFGGFSDADVDVIYHYKKGADELDITSNVYNEDGPSFRYNGKFLEDNELLYFLEENQLINILNYNINDDFSWKIDRDTEQLDEFLIAEHTTYKKDDLVVRITSLPGDITDVYINDIKAEKEELIKLIYKLFNIESKKNKNSKINTSEKISKLQQFKNALLGQKNGKKR